MGVLGLVLLVSLGGFEDARREEARGVVARYEAQFQAYAKASKAARTPREREEAEVVRPKPVADAGRWIEWAARNPMDPVAADLLATIVRHGRFGAEAQQAATKLSRDHLTLKGQSFVETWIRVARWPMPVAERWLRAYLERSPDRSVRAMACLQLAHYKLWLAEHARDEMDAGWVGQLEANFGNGAVDYLKTLDPDRLRAESAGLFELLIRDYGDVESEGTRLADGARPFLAELTKLANGRPAPEIDAEDLDGVRLRLSDQRGKVVVLAFWATWCAPCMAAIPRERDLVKQFEGKPFVFLGINGDPDPAVARRAVAKNQIPWRSFRDGGTISRAWNVRAWPTVYVIDAEGVLRHKNPRPDELERVVGGLLPAR